MSALALEISLGAAMIANKFARAHLGLICDLVQGEKGINLMQKVRDYFYKLGFK